MVLTCALRQHWVVSGTCRHVFLTWHLARPVSTLESGYFSPGRQNQTNGDSFAACNLPIAGDLEYFFVIQHESTFRLTHHHDLMFIYNIRVFLFWRRPLLWLFIDKGYTQACPW